jgi:hypothetical protein
LEAIVKRKRIGAIGSTTVAIIGGLTVNQRAVGATPMTLTGINHFSESNSLTASTYTTTNPTAGSVSFPHIISREFTNAGAYEIVPHIKISLASVPAGQQITGAQLGLFFTDSTYYGGSAGRQEYIDLWAVKDEFTPSSVNMTTYNGTNLWSDGFRAGINHFLRIGPDGAFLSTVWPTNFAPTGTPSSKLNNEADEFKIWSSDQLDSYLTAQHLQGKDAYLQLTNSNASGNSYRFVATGDDNGSFGVHYDAAHQPFLSFDAATLVHKWRLNDSGPWATANNWFGKAIPSGIDKQVEFGSWTDVANVVYPQGSVAVDVGAAKTVGHVTFNTPETYNITGSNPLTLDVTSGSATINVLNGSQVISAPLQLNKNTTVTVAASAPLLVVSGNITAAAGVTVTKAGGGFLEVKNLRGVGLDVTGGKVIVTSNGSDTGTSKLSSVAAATGQLDLINNKLVTATPVGSWNGSQYSDVTGMIASGRNGGTWSGNGIVTSMSDAVGLGARTTLAVATAAQVTGISGAQTALFGGQTVSPTDTLVKYTYAGDADLDGTIDGDDYLRIDAGFSALSSGYFNGDFNYSGNIDVDDYFLIDSNYGKQTLGVLSAPAGVAAVPEPSALALLACGATGLMRRRRRK